MRVKHYLSGMMMAASTLASPAECHSCHHLSQEMIQQPLYDTLSKAKESPSALKVSFAQDTISEDLNYQELMNVSVRKLIRTYGLEKALLIVQECNLQAINTIRAERRLSPLHLDSQLTQAAQNYAEEMSTHKFFSHRGKDGSNHSNRIKKTGYVGNHTGENIAQGLPTVKYIVQAWKASPGHLKNILSPDFTALGVGYSDGYWVNCFGGK